MGKTQKTKCYRNIKNYYRNITEGFKTAQKYQIYTNNGKIWNKITKK